MWWRIVVEESCYFPVNINNEYLVLCKISVVQCFKRSLSISWCILRVHWHFMLGLFLSEVTLMTHRICRNYIELYSLELIGGTTVPTVSTVERREGSCSHFTNRSCAEPLLFCPANQNGNHEFVVFFMYFCWIKNNFLSIITGEYLFLIYDIIYWNKGFVDRFRLSLRTVGRVGNIAKFPCF